MTLETFHLEDEVSHGRDLGGRGISLADLTSCRFPLEWFEAIAVVQELCRAMLEPGVNPGKASLSAKDVFVDSTGRVRVAVNAGGRGEGVVRQIGELLRMSLADSTFPVPLRLVITQASSTPPFYASIEELSTALEYFERPNRLDLIRAAYERGQSHRAVSDVVNQAAPQPDNEKAPVQEKRQRRRISKSAIAASAAVLAVIAICLALSALTTRPQGIALAADLKMGKAGEALTGIASTVGALVNRVNPFIDKPLVGSAPASPAADDKSRRRGSAKAGSKIRRSLPSAPPVALVRRRTAAELSSIYALPVNPKTDEISAEAFATGERADDNAGAETTVYSANDHDVTPPFASYPRLPAEPPAGLRTEDRSTLELLVDETGHVESARLRGQPDHLGEALLATLNLSAAKTWRFLPAVRNGRPVKYRTLVHVWPTTP